MLEFLHKYIIYLSKNPRLSIINITPVSISSFNNMFFQKYYNFQFGNILFLHIYMNKGSKSSVKIRQKAL